MRILRVSYLMLLSVVALSGCKKGSGTGPGSSDSWTQVSGMDNFRTIVSDGALLFASGGDVYRSTDGGLTWISTAAIGNHGDGALALVDSALLSGDQARRSGIYLSSNGGASWAARDSGLPGQAGNYPPVWCFGQRGSNVFAATLGNGIFVSTNTATSWTPVNNGIYTGASVYCLAVTGNRIFAGTLYGVYCSSDDGSTWVPADSGLSASIYNPSQPPWVTSLATCGTSVFAGTDNGLVFLSINDGASWTKISGGLPQNSLSTINLAASGSHVFVAFNGGIFSSNNNGASWTDITDNLPSPIVGRIAVVGNHLFAVLIQSGVWRRTL